MATLLLLLKLYLSFSISRFSTSRSEGECIGNNNAELLFVLLSIVVVVVVVEGAVGC